MLKKKILASFQSILELFTQKFVTKLSEIWVWDLGSGRNLFRMPDLGPGVKKAPDPDPQHCCYNRYLLRFQLRIRYY